MINYEATVGDTHVTDTDTLIIVIHTDTLATYANHRFTNTNTLTAEMNTLIKKSGTLREGFKKGRKSWNFQLWGCWVSDGSFSNKKTWASNTGFCLKKSF